MHKPAYTILLLHIKEGNLEGIKNLYKKYGKIIFEYSYIIDWICEYGHTILLDWFYDNREDIPFNYSIQSMDLASSNNKINVLNWWLLKKDVLELKYSCSSIDFASYKGNINVLNWWFKSGLEIKYSSDSLDSASSENNINVLNYFFDSKIPLKYTNYAMDLASSNGYIDILNFWFDKSKEPLNPKGLNGETLTDVNVEPLNPEGFDGETLTNVNVESKIELKYSNYAIFLACENNKINSLEWWLNSNLELKYTDECMDYASVEENFEILDWFFSNRHKIPLKYSYKSLVKASIKSLEWWYQKRHLIEVKYSSEVLEYASALNDIQILDWFIANDIKLFYNEKTIDIACYHNCYNVVNWWIKICKKNNVPLSYKHALLYVCLNDNIELLALFYNNKNIIKWNITERIINKICYLGNINTLKWLYENNELINYKNAIDMASHYGNVNILDFFYEHPDLEFNYTELALDNSLNATVLDWWYNKRNIIKLKYTQKTFRNNPYYWNNKCIKQIKYEKIDDIDICIVCQEEETNNLIKIDCSHKFHLDCINKWIIDYNQCPLCRGKIEMVYVLK